MVRSEYVKEIKLRIKDLEEEIELNQTILAKLGKARVSGTDDQTNIPDPNLFGTPKGKTNWPEYVEIMLKEVGGMAKATKVLKAVLRANRILDADIVKQAITNHLSKLYKAGKIGARPGASQFEGNEYYILE